MTPADRIELAALRVLLDYCRRECCALGYLGGDLAVYRDFDQLETQATTARLLCVQLGVEVDR